MTDDGSRLDTARSQAEVANHSSDLPSHIPSEKHHNDHTSYGSSTSRKAISTSSTASKTFLDIILYTPRWCRWDPNHPPTFSIAQNILFAFAGAFTVANLYYAQPILNILAADFSVDFLTVSRIPTLCQAGYAAGLLFLCPLGDMLPRRPFVLTLVFATATLWIVLCITRDFTTFLLVSFFTSLMTVTPQIMLPLVGELAPKNQRAFALSIVASGNMLGIVLARILSGVVTNYTHWRTIYWLALALQYAIFVMLFLFMPDYPATTSTSLRRFLPDYGRLLGSILLLYRRHPVLTQAGLVQYTISAAFTAYWTTLTFLLAGAPYHLAPTPIGLFGLIGIASMIAGPFMAKYIIQPLEVPLYSILLGNFINIIGLVIGTFTGTHTLAGPIVQGFAIDAAFQFINIANRVSINNVEPTGRNRVNTAFMLLSFCGQLTGTAAGNKLYDEGGWVATGCLSIVLVGGVANLVVACRGPWERGWIGWGGGWGRRDCREKVEEAGV